MCKLLAAYGRLVRQPSGTGGDAGDREEWGSSLSGDDTAIPGERIHPHQRAEKSIRHDQSAIGHGNTPGREKEWTPPGRLIRFTIET
jgi:hypothetical protein